MRCDSHIHIVGPPERYPQLAARTYLAGLATLERLRAAGATRGVSRFVVVQPSFYGTDNSLLLDSLDALGGDGRGVAVVAPDTPPDILADYSRRGVRGLRINLYSPLGGARRLDDMFAAMAALAGPLNWHIEVIAPIRALADHAALLAASPVPVVIDHYGLHGASRPDSAEGAALLGLLRHRHIWMKLSAPYRVSDDPLATRPDPVWLKPMLDVAADRCVWGSDWPHTPPHDAHGGGDAAAAYRDLSYGAVVDDFVAALPAPDVADRIMRDNPVGLYEFAAPA